MQIVGFLIHWLIRISYEIYMIKIAVTVSLEMLAIIILFYLCEFVALCISVLVSE